MNVCNIPKHVLNEIANGGHSGGANQNKKAGFLFTVDLEMSRHFLPECLILGHAVSPQL